MDLALRGDDGPVALASVSERQKISLSYLEQLFGKLRRYNLVDSVRGPGGGYCIARPLDTVTVADIVRAVDEPLDATQCGGRENCLDDHRCMTHDLWAALNAKMYDYLSSVTLAGLVERQRAKEAKTGSAAVIEDRRIGPQPRTRAARDKVAAVA
jgi:Rrf2 family iron-sulfur cluster assembly transcriptional regulator